MDNQNISQNTPNIPVSPPPATAPQGGKSSLLTRKTIFIILGIVILAELIWAGWSLLQPRQSAPVTSRSTSTLEHSATASLVASKNEISVGETVIVTLNIAATGQADGVDLIVSFDPKLLSAEATPSGVPVQVGTIFNDYPQNRIDTPGKIVVSGITDINGGVSVNGILGTISFKALAPGQARVSLEYQAGSTTDSNVIETGSGKDILNQVNNAEVTILP